MYDRSPARAPAAEPTRARHRDDPEPAPSLEGRSSAVEDKEEDANGAEEAMTIYDSCINSQRVLADLLVICLNQCPSADLVVGEGIHGFGNK